MALQYKIQFINSEPDEDGNPAKRVSFEVKDSESEQFLYIDRVLPFVKNKKDETYCNDALKLMKDDIAEWQDKKKNEGKLFNPDSGAIE